MLENRASILIKINHYNLLNFLNNYMYGNNKQKW